MVVALRRARCPMRARRTQRKALERGVCCRRPRVHQPTRAAGHRRRSSSAAIAKATAAAAALETEISVHVELIVHAYLVG